ncbi:MAG: bifunctional DNA primase/polymerase [Candidatus Methanomethylicaceae archaeon]
MNHTKQHTSTLTAALELHKTLGCNVFPIPKGAKTPNRSWKEFQHRRLTEDEIVALFEQEGDANLAVVCGKIGGLVVLDCDAPDALKRLDYSLPVTPIVETARGRHYYFRGTTRTTRLADGLDVRAEGAYVISPPSLHPSGKKYEWIISPWEADPAPCPAWLHELLTRHNKRPQSASLIADILNGVPEGQRNIASAKLIGYLLAHLPQEAWEGIVWPFVCDWNQLNSPPLDERQLRYTFDCIARKESARARKDRYTLLKILYVAIKNSKLSLRELAQEAGVSKSTIHRLAAVPLPFTSSGTETKDNKLQMRDSGVDCPKEEDTVGFT